MTYVVSNNPNLTRAKERLRGYKSISYPTGEVLSSSTRLRFVEYNRFNPADIGSEKTSSIITLPLPINVPENYAMNVTGHDMGAMGMLNNRNAEAVMNKTQNIDWSNLKSIAQLGASGATDAIKSRGFSGSAALAGILASRSSSDTARNITAFTGIVQNPHTTVMFDGVNLRTITLEWRFSARSEEDSRTLRRIYDMIKLSIHPAEALMGYALNYLQKQKTLD